MPEATPLPTPLVSRHRGLFTIGLAAAIGLAVVLGVVAILVAPKTKPHLVTIPRADRNASPALVTAAEAIGYRPATKSDSVERGPISGAPSVPGGLLPLGSVAPAFRLRTPAGTAVGLESLRGKAVLLEFFATWCPHCAAEAPHLVRLARSLPAKRFSFVGVNADSEDAKSVFAYHVWFGLPFPALVDHGSSSVTWPDHGPIGPVSSRYGVDRFPTFYVLDRNGRIAWRSSGEQPDALLRLELKRAETAQ
jgi:thiol-disulfide isomerase/thioredoxin